MGLPRGEMRMEHHSRTGGLKKDKGKISLTIEELGKLAKEQIEMGDLAAKKSPLKSIERPGGRTR
jgi:hypothetical protein